MMFGSNPKNIEARILYFARHTPELLPSCMVFSKIHCDGCILCDQDSCILLKDKDFLSFLRWKILNISIDSENDAMDNLVVALVEVFESQGSALHMDKVLSLLLRQNSELRINISQLKKTLKSNSSLFKETDTNVFTLNSDESYEHEADDDQNIETKA